MQIKAILASENKASLYYYFFFQENNLSFTEFLLITGLVTKTVNVKGNLEISKPSI